MVTAVPAADTCEAIRQGLLAAVTVPEAQGSPASRKRVVYSKPDCSARGIHCPPGRCSLLPAELSARSCWLAQAAFV